MSIGETINKMFGGAPAQPQQPGQVMQPGTGIPATAGQTAPETSGTAANGVIPAESAPLDKFNDLWKNEPKDPNAPPVDESVFGNVNGDDLLKAAGGIDFTKAVTPELLSRIKEGGDAGVQATLEAINKVTQLNYAQSAHTTTKLIEQAITKAKEQFQATLPSHIRNQGTADLIKENAALSHPAAAPMVQGLVHQLQLKYPDASPAELTKQAQDYFISFSQSMMGSVPAATPTTQEDKTDWENWFKTS